MEIGQIMHNNPVGLSCPHYVDALVTEVRAQIERVYWNVHQKKWYGAIHEWDEDRDSVPPLGIPGMEWNNYYNWGGSPEDDDWDQAKADAPNFSFQGVEVRWYKYFGRSMNVNRDWSPAEWVRWFDECMDALAIYEERSHEITDVARIIPENAPYRCDKCERFFHWPAKRCGYDGTDLTKWFKSDAT